MGPVLLQEQYQGCKRISNATIKCKHDKVLKFYMMII